jgi:hypothetical protein
LSLRVRISGKATVLRYHSFSVFPLSVALPTLLFLSPFQPYEKKYVVSFIKEQQKLISQSTHICKIRFAQSGVTDHTSLQ